MKAVLIFLLYLTKCSVANVYWEDYDGSVPPDAILGGTDVDGYDTYIGLIGAMDEETIDTPDMVSATIYRNDSYGYAAYHAKVYKSNKGVKIMGTSQPDKFHWTFHPIESGCTLVRGSYTNPWANYYIGRTSYNGEIVSGRFTLDSVLIVPQRDIPDSLLVFTSYEMLVYCE